MGVPKAGEVGMHLHGPHPGGRGGTEHWAVTRAIKLFWEMRLGSLPG